jgi:hypothetical protein
VVVLAVPQSCQSQTIIFYLFDCFQGQVIAKGMVQDRQCKMIRPFTVDIKGKITGKKLTLTEDFVFDDGEPQQRIWHIEQLDKHSYLVHRLIESSSPPNIL